LLSVPIPVVCVLTALIPGSFIILYSDKDQADDQMNDRNAGKESDRTTDYIMVDGKKPDVLVVCILLRI